MIPGAPRFEVVGLNGVGEVRPGADLAEVLVGALAHAGEHLADGDIVVVTSKIVSKSEGRLLTGVDRDEAIDAEAVRTVSEWTTPRGRTRVVETRHGFVMAAGGVDASNVEPGTVVLLPVDPDGSARALRDAVRERLGIHVGVLVTDTAGRAWRMGVVDLAIGSAGLRVVEDLRGRVDPYGNDLEVTVVAVADELAAATELVRTKLSAVPIAVVRGLSHLLLSAGEVDPGSRPLIRPAAEDRFRLGTPEAMRAGVLARTDATAFGPGPVDHAVVRRAIQAAGTAPAPAAAGESRFLQVEDGDRAELAQRWPNRREADLLSTAAHVIVPCVSSGGDAALLALGAAVENLLITLAADGLAAVYLFPPAEDGDISNVLDVPPGWTPKGLLAVGPPP